MIVASTTSTWGMRSFHTLRLHTLRLTSLGSEASPLPPGYGMSYLIPLLVERGARSLNHIFLRRYRFCKATLLYA